MYIQLQTQKFELEEFSSIPWPSSTDNLTAIQIYQTRQ